MLQSVEELRFYVRSGYIELVEIRTDIYVGLNLKFDEKCLSLRVFK